MNLQQLSPPKKANKKRKRVGRGPGSGHGKTSCRGHKGLKARTGGSSPPGYEGGQMPLIRRLPKRGFTNIFKEKFHVINIRDLERFEPASIVDIEALRKAGIIKGMGKKLKVLGGGALNKPLVVRAHKFSVSAKNKIEAIGGKVESI